MGTQIRTFGCPKFHLSVTRIKHCPFFGVLINNEFLLGRECLHGTVVQKLSGPLRIGQRNAKTWKGEVIAWDTEPWNLVCTFLICPSLLWGGRDSLGAPDWARERQMRKICQTENVPQTAHHVAGASQGASSYPFPQVVKPRVHSRILRFLSLLAVGNSLRESARRRVESGSRRR